MSTRSVGFISALIYTGIALLMAGGFIIVTLFGDYNWVTRIGGASWVFLLAMVILMPIVTPLVKKRRGQ
ncbi:MAG: hypothetical protein HW402_1256 [Dehalococcoidales bacterium]|nr:hypothetical protein [Dehalococcoidales bacterium]